MSKDASEIVHSCAESMKRHEIIVRGHRRTRREEKTAVEKVIEQQGNGCGGRGRHVCHRRVNEMNAG